MNRRTQQEWLALFEQHQASGLTIKAFCQQKKLNSNYFSKRRRELLRREEDDSAPSFIKVRAHIPAPSSSAIILRVGTAELNLPLSASPRWVAELLKAMA